MATVTIGYLPDLTKEEAREVFERGLEGVYTMEDSTVMRRDFVVRKSAWAGVGVRLEQGKDATTFVFSPMIPNLALNTLIGGVAPHLFLRSEWQALEREVAAFIESAPEFQPAVVREELRAA